MKLSVCFTGLGVLGGAIAQSSSGPFESLRAIPAGWRRLQPAQPSTQLRLQIAVQHPNQELFEQTLLDISTPDHPSYGQHLKQAELKRMLRPKSESTDAVMTWLSNSGIQNKDIEDDGEWINFRVSVSQAEYMLSTKFDVYGHNNLTRIRTLHYSVPQNVSSHITMIQPTTRFGSLSAQFAQPFKMESFSTVSDQKELDTVPFNATACNATITPACLRALYNIGNYTATPSKKSLFGVAGYLNQYAKYDDLATFTKMYAPYASDQNFSYALINGGLATQNDTVDGDVEANLDIQYAVAISAKTPITYYSTGGRGLLVPDLDQPNQDDNQNEPYLDFLTYMLALPDGRLPQTLTTSYGEDEQSVPAPYARVVCNMFGQLGARGVSILFSSGDTGVGSACQTNDRRNTTRFLPIFPAACPFVTAVGGTRYVQPERAVSFSSGGFSDLFPRPKWQDKKVKAYLDILGNRWKGLYNREGRGFPDVAAQGYRYHVIDKSGGTVQRDILVSGTSASAPMFAAVVSLLNNKRLAAGKPPLGWLNPWLYSEGYKGLTDITLGGSTGCTGKDIYSGLPTPFVPYASWNATKGWDPVTGLGTPLFDKLIKMV